MNLAPRIVLLGSMGIGKTTAIRTLCGELTVDCDVENLDRDGHSKATTTVGADFGVIDLGDGRELHIYGSPGQDRFSFVRDWLLTHAIAVILMVDIAEPGVIESTLALLAEAEASESAPVTVVLVARPASDDAIDAFSQTLAERCGWAVPALQADPRDRAQMLDVLEVLFAMLSVESTPEAEHVAQ